MTRGEALKDFFRKTILPAASAALLYCIFRSACVKNGELDYLWLWILCGLPFGIWRLRLSGRWDRPVPSELRLCRPYRRLLVAAWYVPLTLFRLLTAGCACIITED